METRTEQNNNNNIGTIQAGAENMRSKVKDQSVDLVICLQAFHLLDARKALNEFSRVLKNNKENNTDGGGTKILNFQLPTNLYL